MNKSEIFKAAHKMAKTFVGSYVARFALALKSIYKSIKKEVIMTEKDIKAAYILRSGSTGSALFDANGSYWIADANSNQMLAAGRLVCTYEEAAKNNFWQPGDDKEVNDLIELMGF